MDDKRTPVTDREWPSNQDIEEMLTEAVDRNLITPDRAGIRKGMEILFGESGLLSQNKHRPGKKTEGSGS